MTHLLLVFLPAAAIFAASSALILTPLFLVVVLFVPGLPRFALGSSSGWTVKDNEDFVQIFSGRYVPCGLILL